MTLEDLRKDLIVQQKKGLPFIMASVVIWILISLVTTLDIRQELENILVFCCAVPLLPLSSLMGKRIGVDIFSKENELGKAGLVFTMNQVLYLLIVMWVFNALPGKMLMVFAMVFGAHLLPYAWLYDSKAYLIFAIFIPIFSLILGSFFSNFILASGMALVELVFSFLLLKETKQALKEDDL